MKFRLLLRSLPFAALILLLDSPSISMAQDLYVADYPGGKLGKYEATTGKTMSASFISDKNGPLHITSSGGNLYVANIDTNTVTAYSATTGAAVAGFKAPSGFEEPSGVAVSGGILYVADIGSGVVRAFNATTGKAVTGFKSPGSVNNPQAVAVSGNVLYVANAGMVIECNATTGATIKAPFISGLSGPDGLAVLGNYLYVANSGNNTVGKYNATTGKAIAAAFIDELNAPGDLAIWGSHLYVSNVGTFNSTHGDFVGGFVGEYDATTGKAIAGFKSPSGLTEFNGITVSVSLPGLYNASLRATGTGKQIPQGSGYATITIGATGGVMVGGELPDGESFSGSGVLSSNPSGSQIVFDDKNLSYPDVTKAGVKGSLAGTIDLAQGTDTDVCTGSLKWIKPQQSKGAYPAAINTTVDVSGGFYQPPATGGSVLPGFKTGTLELSDTAGLSPTGKTPLDQAVTLDSAALKLTPPVKDKLTVAITPATGIFKGTFVYPGQKTPTAYIGVLIQSQTEGEGFFVGPNGSGTVSLTLKAP